MAVIQPGRIDPAARRMARSPKHMRARGEAFARHVMFFFGALPREQKQALFAGFIEQIAAACQVEAPKGTAAPTTKARKGRK